MKHPDLGPTQRTWHEEGWQSFSNMLNEKQFRRRASNELMKIGKQCQALATDRHVYRRFEDEIASGGKVSSKATLFLQMLRGCYTDAMLARLSCLLNMGADGTSLRKVLDQIMAYPELFRERITQKEFTADLAQMDGLSGRLKQHMEPHLKRHELSTAALASTHRMLDAALDFLADILKKYYWIVADAYLEISPLEQTDFIRHLLSDLRKRTEKPS